MLPKDLEEMYEVTAKVTAPKFRNATLGLVDLGKISEPMAKKLVKTGHLKVKEKSPQKAKESTEKKESK